MKLFAIRSPVEARTPAPVAESLTRIPFMVTPPMVLPGMEDKVVPMSVFGEFMTKMPFLPRAAT